MPLTTRNITHTIFGQDGVELANAVVTAELSNDELDTTNNHTRVNSIPAIQVTANGSGVATLTLPDNINNTYYTVKTFEAGTTDFTNTSPLVVQKIRVEGSDADLVDIIAST